MAKLTTEKAAANDTTAAVPRAKVHDGPKSQRQLPSLPPFPDFRFYVHPERWKLGACGVQLDLVKLKIKPGVNGVVQYAVDAPIITSGASQNLEEAGYSRVPDDIDGRDHVVGHVTTQGRTYLARWEHPIPGSDVIRVDLDDARAFAAALRKAYGEPPVHVLERLHAEALTQLSQLEDKVTKKPSLARMIPGAKAAVAAVAAEIEKATK